MVTMPSRRFAPFASAEPVPQVGAGTSARCPAGELRCQPLSPNTGKIRFYDAQTSSLWEEKLIIAEHRGFFFTFWTSLW